MHIRREPVMLASLVRGILMVMASVGIVISDADADAIVAAVPAIAAIVDGVTSFFYVRSRVSPVAVEDDCGA